MSAPVIRDGDEDRRGPPNVGLLVIQPPDATASPRIFNLIVLPVRINEGSSVFSLFCFHYYYYYYYYEGSVLFNDAVSC